MRNIKTIVVRIIVISFVLLGLKNCFMPFCVKAEDLYGMPFVYIQRTSDNRLDMSCYDYNVQTKTSASTWKGVKWGRHLQGGQMFWNSSNSINGTKPNSIVSCYFASSGKAHIWYAVPTVDSWESLEIDPFDYENILAVTIPCDTAGREVKGSNYSLSNLNIRSANIYFNPELSKTNVNLINNANPAATVAHELGHALGFGHTKSGSIMMQGAKHYTSLQNYDVECLIKKYR